MFSFRHLLPTKQPTKEVLKTQKLATMSTPFEVLDDIPFKIQYWLPKPLNHPDDPNKIIISTDFDGGIFALDLLTNELTQLNSYESRLIPEEHGHFIHPPSKSLFIFGPECFGSFELNSNKFHINNSHLLSECDDIPRSCYVECKNEVHVLHNGGLHEIYKLNTENTNIELISIASKSVWCHYDILYVPSQQKIYTFGLRNSPCVFYFDVMDKSTEWQNNRKMNMPYHTIDPSEYNYILGFENIVFVFYFRETHNLDIWCFHLLNNQSFKSQYKVPEDVKMTVEAPDSPAMSFAIKDGDDCVHIMNFETRKHVKANLYQLVPKALLKSHRNYYQPLIMGYLRTEENQINIPCIPLVLKTLILDFFAL